MDDERLTLLLNSANPAPEPDVASQQLVAVLVAQSRAQSNPRCAARRDRILAAGTGLALATVLAGGGAAVAGGTLRLGPVQHLAAIFSMHTTTRLPSGASCDNELRAMSQADPAATPAEMSRAVDVANGLLAKLRPSQLNFPAALREVSQPNWGLKGTVSDDELHYNAQQQAVSDYLERTLRSQGLPMVAVTGRSDCEGADW